MPPCFSLRVHPPHSNTSVPLQLATLVVLPFRWMHSKAKPVPLLSRMALRTLTRTVMMRPLSSRSSEVVGFINPCFTKRLISVFNDGLRGRQLFRRLVAMLLPPCCGCACRILPKFAQLVCVLNRPACVIPTRLLCPPNSLRGVHDC
jgi:hypothetical protein